MNTWGSLQDNPIAADRPRGSGTARCTDAPPQFLTIPFGLHDAEVVTDFLHHAGFSYVQSAVVELHGREPVGARGGDGRAVRHAAVHATAGARHRDPRGLVDAVAARLAREGGFAPMRLPMKAFVFTAQ